MLLKVEVDWVTSQEGDKVSAVNDLPLGIPSASRVSNILRSIRTTVGDLRDGDTYSTPEPATNLLIMKGCPPR